MWERNAGFFRLAGLPDAVFLTLGRAAAIGAQETGPEVAKERIRSAGLDPVAVAVMEQVHGGAIQICDKPDDTVFEKCDALVTGQRGVALVVRSADCLPVSVFDPVLGVIGLAHAGWRGLRERIAAGLVETMHREYGVRPSDLLAGIGPGIGSCCYEVGPEMEPVFGSSVRIVEGRRFLDLKASAVGQLAGTGISAERIFVSPWCTFCDREGCCSYRRDGESAGRMLTYAMLL
ncbi:MAG: polyphenol oxidase family protein [Candidatus Omnitrophica bacterium]|nr:polyphenol oxidase family protein [Candidatus Omnitrophota bacterium]